MSASEDSIVVTESQKVVLSNCQGGIGIKIVGGKTSSGASYGIFVKKTIPGSPAERDCCLREGDKIIEVNNEDFRAVSNERAMNVLLNAAKTGVVTFLIERSDTSKREYEDLVGTLNNGISPIKYGNSPQAFPQHTGRPSATSPTTIEKRSWVLAEGRMSPLSPGRSSPSNFGTPTAPSGAKPVINSKEEISPVGGKSNHGNCSTNGERPSSLAESNGDSGLQSSSSTLANMSHVTVACFSLRTGLGMSITGGSNHIDGPSVIVKELIDGGDVECDGQIKQGDQIVSINGESFLNVTHEEAKMKLTQLKLRTENFEITYISHGLSSLEKRGEDFDAEDNPMINSSTVGGPVASVKESSNLSRPELSQKQLGSQTSKAHHLDENDNYHSNEIMQPKHFPENEHFSSVMQASIQPSSIPFYLQQDLALSPELSSTRTTLSTSQNFENGGRPSRVKRSPKRRLSLAPTSRLRVEKLEVALSYLGMHLTPQQQEGIRGKLHVDAAGLVSYGEFVNVVQEVLSVELQDQSQALNQGRLRFALRDVENGLALDYPVPKVNDDAIEDLKRQLDDALAEARDLRKRLDKKESSKIAEAEKLESIRRTANEALEESMALQDQVFLVTQAKMAADEKDQEYEEVIRLLEDELRLVKSKGTPKQQEFKDLQKKVVILGCQLRKMEVIKRTYEVATKRLLGFAEHVHDCLKRGVLSSSTLHSSNPLQDERDVRSGHENLQQAPGYLSHRHTSQKLADEARDLVRGVRVLLEEEPLPFGWEEAYTSEGERYFINHVTQITSWLHPITHTTKQSTEDV